jgi:hypothetical protein
MAQSTEVVIAGAGAERLIMQSRTQLALLRPGPEVTALRELFSESLTDPAIVGRRSDLLSGADNHYAVGNDAHPFGRVLGARLRRRQRQRDTTGRGTGPRRTAAAHRSHRPWRGGGRAGRQGRSAHHRGGTGGRQRTGGHVATRAFPMAMWSGHRRTRDPTRTTLANCVVCSRGGSGSSRAFQRCCRRTAVTRRCNPTAGRRARGECWGRAIPHRCSCASGRAGRVHARAR